MLAAVMHVSSVGGGSMQFCLYVARAACHGLAPQARSYYTTLCVVVQRGTSLLGSILVQPYAVLTVLCCTADCNTG